VNPPEDDILEFLRACRTSNQDLEDGSEILPSEWEADEDEKRQERKTDEQGSQEETGIAQIRFHGRDLPYGAPEVVSWVVGPSDKSTVPFHKGGGWEVFGNNVPDAQTINRVSFETDLCPLEEQAPLSLESRMQSGRGKSSEDRQLSDGYSQFLDEFQLPLENVRRIPIESHDEPDVDPNAMTVDRFDRVLEIEPYIMPLVRAFQTPFQWSLQPKEDALDTRLLQSA
jgi:hypothetical protein